jgi:hypothetical protein
VFQQCFGQQHCWGISLLQLIPYKYYQFDSFSTNQTPPLLLLKQSKQHFYLQDPWIKDQCSEQDHVVEVLDHHLPASSCNTLCYFTCRIVNRDAGNLCTKQRLDLFANSIGIIHFYISDVNVAAKVAPFKEH